MTDRKTEIIDIDYESVGDVDKVTEIPDYSAHSLTLVFSKLTEVHSPVSLMDMSSGESVDKYLARREAVTTYALKLTKVQDWCIFGDTDKPYLMAQGAERIAEGYGVQIIPVSGFKMETYSTFDKDGNEKIQRRASIHVYAFHPQIGFAAAYGSKSNEKGFYHQDIDDNLKKHALKNASRRAILQLLGLNGLSVEDISEIAGFDAQTILDNKVTFKDGGEGGAKNKSWDAKTREKAEAIDRMIIEMTGGGQAAKDMLISFSKFQKPDKSWYPGVDRVEKLSAPQINKFVFQAVEDEYTNWLAKMENRPLNEPPY